MSTKSVKMMAVADHDSTAISESRYDSASRDFTVKFIDGGSYVFHGVDSDTYTQFLAASSTGNAFQELIRDEFSFTRQD